MTGTQTFLGNAFDNYQNMMQIARCIREAARQRDIFKPRVLELSRQKTNLEEYLPEAIITRFPTHDEKLQPVLPLPFRAPFDDQSFDACFITDAYEHIPAEMRPGLLSEAMRVTRGLALIGSPADSEIVNRVDRLIFDFVWCKYAHEFIPIKQHIEYGLEPLDQMLARLKALGASRVVALPGNFVYRLLHQILIFFETQWENPRSDIFDAVNRIYNERISKYDYHEPCYRYLIVVATGPEIDLDALEERMTDAPEPPESLKEAEGALVEAFRAADARASDELRARLQEINQLRHELWLKDKEIERLKSAGAMRFLKSIVRSIRARL